MFVMTAGPRATLGCEFVVDVPRPRTHHSLNHDPKLLRLRREICEFLSGCRRQPAPRSESRTTARTRRSASSVGVGT
jgi:nitrate/nitrite transport system ATP-binding protein